MDTEFQTLGRRLVGERTTEATHPALPGVLITGSSRFEWLDGEQFLILRSHFDHPDIPDALSILGEIDGLSMHYFDARGVSRLYALTAAGDAWSILMDQRAPGRSFAKRDAPFSQRVTYTLGPEDETMVGEGALSHDDVRWDDDLQIEFRRARA